MPPPVNDVVLGSRFWLVNDFSRIEVQENANANAPERNDATSNVKHDATVFSFVANAGDEMVRSAINRAEVFAAQHTLDEDRRRAAETQSKIVASVLLPGRAKETLLERAEVLFGERHLNGDAATLCSKALDKLMLTREFVKRAESLEPLGADGRNALLNAVLGLAKMLGENRISESAIVELADGNFYDASTTSDLLRLASDSAKKVCETFVGREKFDAALARCEDALRRAKDHMSDNDIKKAQKDINRLKELLNAAVLARTTAVSFVKCDYQFTDPTGKTKSDIAFQEKQLDQIRDSLRAFRYNLDKRRGVSMGTMESVRRFFDNAFSDFKGETLNADSYNALLDADTAFKTLAGQIMRSLDPDGLGIAAELHALSLDETATAATRISHLTNDRIRYHNSGVERRQRESMAALRKELDAAVGSGGSRTVTLNLTADALFGIDVEWGKLQAKAGLSGVFTASIKVANDGGRVDVTYTKGLDIHAGADAKIGTDPDADGAVPGVGANASGQVKGAYERSVTKTYASIDEFVRTIGPCSRLVNPRFREYIYSLAKGAVRGIGHGLMLGFTGLGFRIHRSKMDQVKYAAELRKRDVFGPMAGLLLPRRNTVVLEKSVDSTKSGTIQGEGEVGFYFSHGDGVATDKKLGGGAQYSYARINRLSHKTYTSFAKSLADCTQEFLDRRFTDELNRCNDAGIGVDVLTFAQDLRRKVDDARSAADAARALADLTKMFDDIEADAAEYGKDDRGKWVSFARRCRMLAAAAALLMKRAEANLQENAVVVNSVRDYLLPRIANPAVEMPEDVFLDEMHEAFNMVLPVKSRHSTRFTFTFDLFQSGAEDLVGKGMEKVSGGKLSGSSGNAFVSGGSESLQSGLAGIGRGAIGLSGSVELLVTKENIVSDVLDKRPWANGNKLTVEAHIPANLPLRLLIEYVTRAVIKSKSGSDAIEESKIGQEIKNALMDPLKTELEEAALKGAGKLLETGIDELAKKSAAFAKLLGAITFIGPKFESSDNAYKALRFTFVNGRFSSFTQGEGYDYKGKLSVKVPFFGASLGLSSSTIANDYSLYTKPSFVDILGVANDYNGAGNQEAFKTFLFRNLKGVKRLMKIVSNRQQEEDDHIREDREWFAQMLASLQGQIERLSRADILPAQDALRLKDSLATAIRDAQTVDPDGDVHEFVAKTQKMFSTMAKAYGLLAKAGNAV